MTMNANATRLLHQRTPRRGIAMALVFICVAVATILAASYLASRDNSGPIGLNVAGSAAARSAAISGFNRALAVMETPTAWRNTAALNLGVLLHETTADGSQVVVLLTDQVNGLPPSPKSEYFRIEVKGRAGGVTQYVTATAYVPAQLPVSQAAAVDLSEFAIAADQEILLDDYAQVGRWPNAPLAALGRRTQLAVAARNTSSVIVGSNAMVVDGLLVHDDDAPPSVVTYPAPANPFPLATRAISGLPLPPPPLPTEPRPDDDDDLNDLDVASPVTINSNRVYDDIIVRSGKVLTINVPATIVVRDDVTIEPNGKILISAPVELIVWNDFTLESNASILNQNGTLRLFVGDDFTCTSSRIVDAATAETGGGPGSHPYAEPWRLKIFEIAGAQIDTRTWTIAGDSILKTSLYGPTAHTTFSGDTILYGRIVARRIKLFDNASVFYDHALDARCGYATAGSGVFSSGSVVRPEIASLASIDSKDIDNLAAELGFAVISDGAANLDHYVPPTASGTPTPRIAPIECEVLAVGPQAGAGAHPLEAE